MSKGLRRATRRRAVSEAKAEAEETEGELPEISVMASGCLGLISFPREPGRLTLERIAAMHPELVPTLTAHPGIGFVLVRSAEHGALALGANGVHHLDTGEIDGEDPLIPFGPNAVRHLKRTDGFEHCPDIVVNSTYWEKMDEVHAFEELVGSHGGMGGTQSFPFLLHPVELVVPDEPLIGAEHVHRVMRSWLVQLGHERYRDEAVAATPSRSPSGTAPAS